MKHLCLSPVWTGKGRYIGLDVPVSLWSQTVWVWFPACPHTCCVNLDKLLVLSGLHLWQLTPITRPHYGTCYIGNHVCEGQLRDMLTLTQSSRTLESGKHECHVGVMFRRTMPAWKEPLALVRFPWAGGCRGCWKPGRSYPPGSSGQWGNGRFTKEEPAWLPKNLWRVWGRAGSAQGLGAGAERVVEEEVCWAIKAGCSWQGAGEHCLVRSKRELQALPRGGRRGSLGCTELGPSAIVVQRIPSRVVSQWLSHSTLRAWGPPLRSHSWESAGWWWWFSC